MFQGDREKVAKLNENHYSFWPEVAVLPHCEGLHGQKYIQDNKQIKGAHLELHSGRWGGSNFSPNTIHKRHSSLLKLVTCCESQFLKSEMLHYLPQPLSPARWMRSLPHGEGSISVLTKCQI